jgi:hypothetical protein
VLANNQIYDPAYKMQVAKTGVDLAAALNCGTASAPTCGSAILSNIPTTQTLSGTPAVPYIAGNPQIQTNIEGRLGGFAKILQGYIQRANNTNVSTINPNMQVEDLIGGVVIDISQPLPLATANPVSELPLSAYSGGQQYSWTVDVPDQFRTTVLVQIDNLNSSSGQLLYAKAQFLLQQPEMVTPTMRFRTTLLRRRQVAAGCTPISQSQDSPQTRVLTVQDFEMNLMRDDLGCQVQISRDVSSACNAMFIEFKEKEVKS